MLIKVAEYAEKHGYKPATVSYWCRKGILPEARKMFTGKNGVASCIYMIPEDAKPIREKRSYRKKLAEEDTEQQPEKKPKAPKIEYPLKSLVTHHDKCEHIKKHCIDRTYAQLRRETGMSLAEIRRVYDRLHEVYGI